MACNCLLVNWVEARYAATLAQLPALDVKIRIQIEHVLALVEKLSWIGLSLSASSSHWIFCHLTDEKREPFALEM